MALAELRQIVKRYPGLSVPALDSVDVELQRGEVVVLVGANGSGKTTLMEILCGLRTPTSGTVSFMDSAVVPGGDHRRAMGIQLQNGGLPQRLRVGEAVRAVACLHRDPGDVESVLAALGLDKHIRQMIDQLSGGWQRRLDIALACLGRPDLLILDEPTSGLDPVARTELWEFLRGRRASGATIFASTHDLAEAEAYSDRLIVLDQGVIVIEGLVQEVLAAAGGDTRVRVIDGSTNLDSLVTSLGHTPYRTGSNVSILGERESLALLRDELELAQSDGRITYTDVVMGPVRLEDIFARAAQSSRRNSEQH